MAITTSIANSFKEDLLEGAQQLTTDQLKLALYDNVATLGAATTVYSATNEVSGVGYTAGGNNVSNVTVTLDSGVAYLDFDNVAWTSATFTAAGALLYNSDQANATIAVWSFGGDISVSNGTFNVTLPAPGAATAVIRLS